jgi:transposase
MKKNSIAKLQVSKREIRRGAKQRLTVGLDLGDRESRYCILDERGEKASEGKVGTTKEGLRKEFGKMGRSRMALEVGTHSPWVSRQLAEMGHEVIVANPRKVKLITQSVKKNDRMDAEQLARLARVDPKLLSPIRHRGAEAQADLAVIRARDGMVGNRTAAINTARGLAKPMGERLKKCDADSVTVSLAEGLSEATRQVVVPILRCVEEINKVIGVFDKKIEEIEKRYPETKVLKQVYGVGRLVALTYILTIEDKERFEQSRDVGPYLGLTRKIRESGESRPELGISKAGDELLRRLLVQSAHCVMRRDAPDCDLRATGLKLQGGGGKRGRKKKAAVAVARKLAVLLHRLWVTGEVYDPHYNRKAAAAAAERQRVAGGQGKKKSAA